MPLLCFVLCLLHEVLPDLLPWHFLKDRPCAAPLIAISLICMWLFHYNSLNLSSHVARATESRFARWLAHSGAVVQTLAFLGPALAMRLPPPPTKQARSAVSSCLFGLCQHKVRATFRLFDRSWRTQSLQPSSDTANPGFINPAPALGWKPLGLLRC